ncbi:HNH endonuclease [Microbacterium phage A3Wally]|nr:HNH endonuclease [Microbacterium phage A3Wally]
MSKGQKYTDEQREAQRARVRKHYQENKQYYKNKAKKRNEETRQWVRDVKEASPCADCGEFKPYYIMHFDHLGIEPKLFNISENVLTLGRAKIQAEIDKCELVCSNCHGIRTWKRQHNMPL